MQLHSSAQACIGASMSSPGDYYWQAFTAGLAYSTEQRSSPFSDALSRQEAVASHSAAVATTIMLKFPACHGVSEGLGVAQRADLRTGCNPAALQLTLLQFIDQNHYMPISPTFVRF